MTSVPCAACDLSGVGATAVRNTAMIAAGRTVQQRRGQLRPDA
jgi:hypothetical protein